MAAISNLVSGLELCNGLTLSVTLHPNVTMIPALNLKFSYIFTKGCHDRRRFLYLYG